MTGLTMADFADCLDTPERTEAELAALESELAKAYGLGPEDEARPLLLALDDAGKLDDSPLVADWRATYARHLSYGEHDDVSDDFNGPKETT